MADWKRQVGALNAMGKSHAKLNDIALVRERKAQHIALLIEKLKARERG